MTASLSLAACFHRGKGRFSCLSLKVIIIIIIIMLLLLLLLLLLSSSSSLSLLLPYIILVVGNVIEMYRTVEMESDVES